MEELIKRLERVIATGAPDKDGQHPISAETVLEVVKGMGMSYRKHLMTSDEPPSELYKAAEVGTNLQKVGTDCISRQAAIDALVAETIYTEEELKEYYEANSHRNEWLNGIYESIETVKQLPPIQPVIVPCDYAKACNEATMDKLTSAVAYYDVLEELRKHGYVLVDLREVNHESN